LRPLLRHRDEQRVVHALVVAPERMARVDSLRPGGADRLAGVPPGPDRKLLERCLIGKQQFESRRRQALLRVPSKRHASLPPPPKPLRAEPRQVHEAGEGKQRLVRRDVRGRLLAADVLLTGLKGEDIAALARGVSGLTDDPSRHPPDVVGAGGNEAVVRASERLIVAGALPFADRDRAAVITGRLEDAERYRVDVRDWE